MYFFSLSCVNVFSSLKLFTFFLLRYMFFRIFMCVCVFSKCFSVKLCVCVFASVIFEYFPTSHIFSPSLFILQIFLSSLRHFSLSSCRVSFPHHPYPGSLLFGPPSFFDFAPSSVDIPSSSLFLLSFIVSPFLHIPLYLAIISFSLVFIPPPPRAYFYQPSFFILCLFSLLFPNTYFSSFTCSTFVIIASFLTFVFQSFEIM